MPEHAGHDHSHIHGHEHRRLSPSAAVDDLMARFSRTGGLFWLATFVCAVLVVGGVVGLAIRLSDGVSKTQLWGYYAAVFAYLMSTVMAMPILTSGLHFTKALWPRPLNRAAMLFAVPGILWGLMFLPLLGVVPSVKGRATIWFNAQDSVMRWVDGVAVFSLVLLGLALLYFRSRPDFAHLRDRGGIRHRLASRLAGGWLGSVREWSLLNGSLTLLGAAYIFLYAYVTFLITTDFDMSLIPGWRSPIYATYHIVTSIQAAIATLLVTLAILRWGGGLRDYLLIDQFWSLGKMLLAFTLFWFYFFWSEFLVLWYGRMPREQALLQTLDFGPYFGAFVVTVLFAFIIPFLLLIWNPIRRSVAGPTVAGISILIGIFFDRIRLYVPAYLVGGVGGAAAGQVPATRLPDLADWLLIIGALGGAALLYLLALRLLPGVSFWEFKVYLMLRRSMRFLRSVVEAVGKPT